MYTGIMGSPCVAYDVPAAIVDPIAPSSLMPSCSIWPFSDSL